MAERWSWPDTLVVTGAGGWLGHALVHHLAAADEERPGLVRAVVKEPSPELAALDGVETVVADVTDLGSVEQALAGLGGTVDVVHAAGLIHPRRTAELFAVNTGGTRNVLAAAARAGVRRLVHVSSNSPFGTNPHVMDRFRGDEPYHPYLGYGRSKMEAELAVLDAVDGGLDAVIVRPPWFYGPHQPPRQTQFFRMVRTGRFPIIGAGDQRRSMVYVGNLVDGVLAASRTPGVAGKGFWIADARPYEVREIVATVKAALAEAGLDVSDRDLHLPTVAARLAERGDRLVQGIGRYQQQLHVLGEMGHTIACDISTSRAVLGYEPAVDLAEGMRRSIRWCLDQGLAL